MKKVLKFLLIKLPLAVILLSVLSVFVLKWVPVKVTPLIVSRSIEFRKDTTFHTSKQWCKLEDISPELIKAVIVSEDSHFLEHKGFDYEAIRRALERRKTEGVVRGASTISQQTAKNVFTFHKRTFWRKGIEAWFTFLIERIWGKERIMEVYLNVAEMGKGIYGAQAAAQAFFKKDAAALTRREASTLAASLPAPLKQNADHPTTALRNRTAAISRMIPDLKYPDWVEHKEQE